MPIRRFLTYNWDWFLKELEGALKGMEAKSLETCRELLRIENTKFNLSLSFGELIVKCIKILTLKTIKFKNIFRVRSIRN